MIGSKLVLLLDMDDTLLVNDMEKFTPAYLKALGDHLSPFVDPDRMVKELLTGIRRMMKNTDPELTLENSFDNHFYQSIGLTKNKIIDQINQFYQLQFPLLQPLTEKVPEAGELIRHASQSEWKVGIATNPLFPRSAILHRLSWAGFPEAASRFDLIPSFEDFHFCKPHPEFFAEFLAQMGWPDLPVVMAGNSLSDDIKPAASLGIHCYQIINDSQNSKEPTDQNFPSGNLVDLKHWLSQNDSGLKKISFESPTSVLAVLKTTPAALSTVLKNNDPDRVALRPDPQEWSIVEIIYHLHRVESMVFLRRINQVLNEENPLFTLYDNEDTSSSRFKMDLPDELNHFSIYRNDTLHRLDSVDEKTWKRTGFHPERGTMTLLEVARTAAMHDQDHIRQLFSTLVN